MDAAAQDAAARKMEALISRVLWGGVTLSLVLIALGTLLSFYQGGYGHGAGDVARLSGPAGAFPRSWSWFSHGLSHFDGQAIIVLGLLSLIATPIVRVAVSLVGFSKEGDRTYVVITAVVLCLLLLSFALGKAG